MISYKYLVGLVFVVVRTVARRVIVEIELGENARLEDLLKDVKYRVLREELWSSVRRVREKYVERLGGLSSLEEYEELEEEVWLEE